MFRAVMLFAGLGGLLASRPGSQNSFLQIIFPEKIQANTSDNSEVENEQISYIIPIDEKPYTIHLKQRFFLADNFMVYLNNNQESVNSRSSNIQTQCYYQGYVEGYPNSVVTISTCSGLRGILQFENISYGIEPLEAAVTFQHILYELKNENNEFAVLTEKNPIIEQNPMDSHIFISEKSESAVSGLIPLYLEMHVVVDKVLYDFLGSNSVVVTNKVIEIIGLVNSVFAKFKVTIVLSSLELWSDKNKISTVGEADELLHRFLDWKKTYLTLRPHDIAYLFTYREYPDYVGATFPGKMCVTHYSAGIVLYPKEVTLEAFSVIVTQMLGFSLGISYDDPKKCQCSGAICIMNPKAMQTSGVKTFSNCSLSDFENFISNMGARCLQNKPQIQWMQAICGNGKLENGEICDCGTEEQCGPNSCCNPKTCMLKPESECDTGLCCHDCKFLEAGTECRPVAHPYCDLPEFCNGSSGACTPDITIHNGRVCQGGSICFDGVCPDSDARCASIFGEGSKNAPFACYEEIQAQRDRFGNCGLERGRYRMCMWRSLMCGRLICTYPSRVPFYQENIAVIYAYVRGVVCVTLDYSLYGSLTDRMVIHSGSVCDTGRVCIKGECIESKFLKNEFSNCSKQCHGNGVCTSESICHCFPGYRPPDCQHRIRDASMFPEAPGLLMKRAFLKAEKNRWLLGFYIALPVLFIATIIAVSWNYLKKWFTKEEEFLSSESEDSIQTYATRSRSESSNQTDSVRSQSESSTQTYISSKE